MPKDTKVKIVRFEFTFQSMLSKRYSNKIMLQNVIVPSNGFLRSVIDNTALNMPIHMLFQVD